MKNFNVIIFCLLFSLFNLIYGQKQFETEGVIVPRTIDYKYKKLELNGFGTRSKLWIDVYVQALYLSILSQDPKEILESNTEMAVRIQIISPLVTSEKLSKALRKGLVKSVGKDKILEIKSQSDLLQKFISNAPTKKNDFFNLIYDTAEESIIVFKNDILVGKIPGFKFKKAFFGIWLSDNPVDKDLRNDLLGKN